MMFWLMIAILFILLLVVFDEIPNSIKKYIPWVVLFVFWFITGFRFEIGWDYDTYVYMYGLTGIEADIVRELSEPTFVVIIDLLQKYGFSSQMLFVIYSTIEWGVLGLSIFKLTANSKKRLIGIYIYIFTPFLFWTGLSTIRQEIAIVLGLYAYIFYIKNNKMLFFLIVIIAISFHYSAVTLFLVYFIPKKTYSIKCYTLFFCCCIIVMISGVIPFLLEVIISFSGFEKYMNYSSGTGTGLSFNTIIFDAVYIFLFYSCIQKCPDRNKEINIYAFFIFLQMVLSFSDVILRLKGFFLIMYIPLLIDWYMKVNYLKKCAFVLMFAMLWLGYIHITAINENAKYEVNKSAGNIEYECNLKLFEE